RAYGSGLARSLRRAYGSCRLPQRETHLLLDRKRLVDAGERALGVHERPAELDERVAGEQRAARRRGEPRPGLLLQLEHDALGCLATDAGDRLEARRVFARDRAAELVGRRAGDDRERDLRPDSGDPEQELEQLALLGRGEPVQLERVLANVEVRLDRRLLPH